MQSSIGIDVEQTLDDLASSSFPTVRRAAAHKLGQLTMSSAEIVQALGAADTLDTDAEVRSTAREALQSPVHQDFIQQHPGFLQRAAETAIEQQKNEKAEKESKIIAEFIVRRNHERRNFLIFFGGWIISCGLLFLALDIPSRYLKSLVCIYQVAIIAFAILIFGLSWGYWRCPACDGWLGGWKAQVNPWFSSEPLRCPHCGARLL